ncbi:Dabb family protein [Vibrio sp. Isolate25]|uniref:Dabb family protein n=1 Tax=Vibrio sp. Isolate25 TaxID=2908535 RepID=UPI001EFC60DC|nr:Dabb family protein [Vibrio sp. Isolate25]MCG9595467.1 Dabb family protein [Vibrio sp. Isolate25]
MIRHILLIQFKPDTTPQQVEDLKASFLSMTTKVEGVDSVEWGLNDSPEGKNKHYTHCVMMTFSDEDGRNHYLPHPEHEALKDIFRPILEDIVVFDYTV